MSSVILTIESHMPLHIQLLRISEIRIHGFPVCIKWNYVLNTVLWPILSFCPRTATLSMYESSSDSEEEADTVAVAGAKLLSKSMTDAISKAFSGSSSSSPGKPKKKSKWDVTDSPGSSSKKSSKSESSERSSHRDSSSRSRSSRHSSSSSKRRSSSRERSSSRSSSRKSDHKSSSRSHSSRHSSSKSPPPKTPPSKSGLSSSASSIGAGGAVPVVSLAGPVPTLSERWAGTLPPVPLQVSKPSRWGIAAAGEAGEEQNNATARCVRVWAPEKGELWFCIASTQEL